MIALNYDLGARPQTPGFIAFVLQKHEKSRNLLSHVFLWCAQHGRNLTGGSPEHTLVVGSV